MVALFNEFALVFMLIFALSYIVARFKQPTLIAYIIGGILLGPLFFNLLSSTLYYEVLSHIGISFLLFIVGLHLNPKLIKEVGLPSLVTGIGQIIVTVLFSIIITLFLGFTFQSAIIISIGLAFSSTIVIVKILSDKRTLDTLSGKISLGFLLVQDFVAVLALLGINSFILYQSGATLTSVLIQIILSISLAVIIIAGAKYVLQSLFSKSFNSELLFLFAIAWSLGISALFNYLGFSLEIGALIAGISLASSQLHHEISSKIKPLRDFFLIMFFIVLGSEMFSSTQESLSLEDSSVSSTYSYLMYEILTILPIALPLILLVLIGNPIIVFLLLTYLKYPSKVAFNSGLAVSQISEFSLIIALLAYQKAIITSQEISLLTFIMLVTIMSSSYLYYHSDYYYKLCYSLLKKINPHVMSQDNSKKMNVQILLTGLSTDKENHLFYLHNSKYSYAVIESSPKKIEHLKKKNIPYIQGDLSNPDFIQELNISSLKAFVSFDNEDEAAFTIVESIRKENSTAHIILKASDIEIANELYELGADHIIVPHHVHHDRVFEILKELL